MTAGRAGRRPVALALIATVVVAGCSRNDGRQLDPPEMPLPATTTTTSTSLPAPFVVESNPLP